MSLKEKLCAATNTSHRSVTIAFLGDSVTQGCFECYVNEAGGIETVYDYSSAYSTRLREILNLLYPNVQVNIINSGISGDNSANGLRRLQEDVLSHDPDLAVVSFGLNDSVNGGKAGLEAYRENIRQILQTLKSKNIQTIFLTQNFMNTYVSCHLQEPLLRQIAANAAQVQADGLLKAYMEAAKQEATACGAGICDMYSAWEQMAAAGVDTTALLSNHINHPVRVFHNYVAIKLIECILSA